MSSDNWNSVEPFAVELIANENKCCVCGNPKVSPFVRIHGLDVRGARIAVGLFHCSEHSDYYEVKDYILVNGLMILERPNGKPIGKWFNLPWWEFQKIVYSRTQFADAFPRFELNKTLVGLGNLCLKTIEIAKIPDSYVMKPNGKSVQEENEGNIKKQAKDFLRYGNSEICTTENKHNYRFRVPAEVYSDDKYFEKLNNARTLQEVDEIIRDYREHSKDEKIAEKKQTKDQKETPKKKRWWQ